MANFKKLTHFLQLATEEYFQNENIKKIDDQN